MTNWDTSSGTRIPQDQNPPWPPTSPWPPQPSPGGPGGTPSGPPPPTPEAVWQQPGGTAALDFNGVLPLGPTAPPGTSTSQLATTEFVTNAITESTTGVASFNTRTGAVTLNLVDITDAGGAPLNNAGLTGNPTAPTQATGTANGTLATTQFVSQALGSFGGVTSFNTRTGAITLNLSDITAAGGAPLASPNLSGTPTVPTAPLGTNTGQAASTSYVMNALGNSVVSWNGRIGAVTMTLSDITTAGGAPLNSPIFTGTPSGTTAAPGTASTQLATTAFVTNAVSAATAGVSSFNTRTGAVTLQAADIAGVGGALLAGPSFTGAPTAPTPAAGSDSDAIATTAFVQTALAGASLVSSFNGRTGAVTLSAGDVSAAGALMETGGAMSGVLTLAGNASTALAAVPYQQLVSVTAGYLPIGGGTLTGSLTLAGNATSPLQATPLQQVVPLAGAVNMTGPLGVQAAEAIPSGAQGIVGPGGWFFGGGGIAYNAYYTGTQWNYLGNGIASAIGLPAAGGFSVSYAPSGTAGAQVTGFAPIVSVDSAGNTTLNGNLAVNQTLAGTSFGMVANSTVRQINIAAGWALAWQTATGTLEWLGQGTATLLMSLSNVGNMTIAGTLTQGSDDRIKTVTGGYHKSLSELMRLEPITFAYLGNDTARGPEPGSSAPYHESVHATAARTGSERVGLSAQALQKIFPECIEEMEGYIDGEPVTDIRHVDTGPLIHALINAVRELGSRVMKLESELGMTA